MNIVAVHGTSIICPSWKVQCSKLFIITLLVLWCPGYMLACFSHLFAGILKTTVFTQWIIYTGTCLKHLFILTLQLFSYSSSFFNLTKYISFFDNGIRNGNIKSCSLLSPLPLSCKESDILQIRKMKIANWNFRI